MDSSKQPKRAPFPRRRILLTHAGFGRCFKIPGSRRGAHHEREQVLLLTQRIAVS